MSVEFTPFELEFLFQRASLPISPKDENAEGIMSLAASCIRKLIQIHNESQIPEGRTVAPAEADVLAKAAKSGRKVKLAEVPKAAGATG